MRFCVYHLRVDLWSNVPLPLLPSKPYWPLKPNILGAYLPKVGYLAWRAHCELETLASWENLWNYNYFPVSGLLTS